MFEAKELNNISAFLNRVQLNGQEAHTLVMLQMKVQSEINKLKEAKIEDPKPEDTDG